MTASLSYHPSSLLSGLAMLSSLLSLSLPFFSLILGGLASSSKAAVGLSPITEWSAGFVEGVNQFCNGADCARGSTIYLLHQR